jgi:hypothetical protein
MRVLTRRELNRAFLARQLLLERHSLSATRAVARLAGLQAQHAHSPYLSLLSRLAGFTRGELTTALERRRLVKALLMRGTLHLVTPRDYWAFSTARRELAPLLWPPAYERLVPSSTLGKLAVEAARELGGGPKTLKEMLRSLESHAHGPISPAFLWRRLQSYSPIVHVPPSGTWGYHKESVYRAAGDWVPAKPPRAEAAFDHLVARYLAAFGPATKHDVGQWAGVPRVGPIGAALERLDTRVFHDEQGRELHDLPRAPRPSADTPAPIRLVPRFDNLVLSHADRSRVLGDVPVSRIVTKNAIVHATILVDGFVVGTWNLEGGRVRLKPFGRLDAAAKREVQNEAERIEAFVRDG